MRYKVKIKLIVAMDLERGIGKNNDLMWHLPSDMRFFKETTLNQIVVMGRKNFESIPEKFRPLPNRENVILTRQKDFQAEHCLVFNSIREMVLYYQNEKNRTVFIIGGGQIYHEALALDIIDEMLITHVNHVFDADTFFPEINESNWICETLFSHEKDDKNPYSFVVKKYSRK
jgi:dihydrofolate reductase